MDTKDSAGADAIVMRHSVLRAIREFFYRRGYVEVETPSLAKTSSPDPYIDPLAVSIGEKGPYYLHTSPEIGMKKLLVTGHGKIFQICKVFRTEEFEEHHSTEFTMLEWYAPGDYIEAMGETRDLIRFVAAGVGAKEAVHHDSPWDVLTLSELFRETVGFDPLPCTQEELLRKMDKLSVQGLHDDDSWEELFFMLLVQEIEPNMQRRRKGPYFIKDWPASLTAMAKKKDAYTVERFELYMRGLEIANGYTELLDADEQAKRLAHDNAARARLGKTLFPVDNDFLDALRSLRGPVAGVSIGVDRLLMVMMAKDRIDDVLFRRFMP